MSSCNCRHFKIGQNIAVKNEHWMFQGEVYMGRLYKCELCGAYWGEYMSGHGWAAFYFLGDKPPVNKDKG